MDYNVYNARWPNEAEVRRCELSSLMWCDVAQLGMSPVMCVSSILTLSSWMSISYSDFYDMHLLSARSLNSDKPIYWTFIPTFVSTCRYHYDAADSRLTEHVEKGNEDGLYISSVASCTNLWALVMDTKTGFTAQVHELSHVFAILECMWVYLEIYFVQDFAYNLLEGSTGFFFLFFFFLCCCCYCCCFWDFCVDGECGLFVHL